MAIVTELKFFLHAASCHCTNNNDSVYTHPNENWCGPCDLLHGLLVLCAAKTHVQWICRGVTNCFQTRSILQATGFLLLPCMGLFNSSYSSKSPVFVARCFSLDSSNILWDRLQSWTTEVCFPIRFFLLVLTHTYLAFLSVRIPFRFIKQILILFLLHQVAISLFRLIASIARNQAVAATLGILSLLVMYLFSGFIIPLRKAILWRIFNEFLKMRGPNWFS